MRRAFALFLMFAPASAEAQVRVCLPPTAPACLSDGKPLRKNHRLLLQCRDDLFLYRENTLKFVDCLFEFRLREEFDISNYMASDALKKMNRAFDLWECKAVAEADCIDR